MHRTSGISERTFGNQAALPGLPVPELDETCERFIEWAEPLLDKRTLADTIEATRRFASEDAPGPLLQAALREFASRRDIGNWLEPFWERMYLRFRDGPLRRVRKPGQPGSPGFLFWNLRVPLQRDQIPAG